MKTSDEVYTERLVELDSVKWRKALDVQAPYRMRIRRTCIGRTLDVGCGLGRHLAHLDGRGVGVDHNAYSVDVARKRGLVAFTPQEFEESQYATEKFDTILISHVLEHLDEPTADKLVDEYVERLRPGGRVVAVTPQEWLYEIDETHVRWVDEAELAAHARRANLVVEEISSFPFPRFAGKLFRYNEFHMIAHRM